ncbi:SGNH/GDSL hydrolase family protein [Flavitalea flava]
MNTIVRIFALLILCSCSSFFLQAQKNIPLPVGNYFTVRYGLKNVYALINENKTNPNKAVRVAYLGGSITYNPGWRDKVDSFLKKEFPSTAFHFMNAGIPSLGSSAHAFRLQQDVLDSGRVDLLFVEAAVNDRANGVDSLYQVRSLEGIIRHAKKSNPRMDIILMAFADPAKTSDYDENRIPVEVTNHERIAAYYHLPSINLAKEVRDKMRNGEFTWEGDFKDLHPSPFGQQLYFATIRDLLLACLSSSLHSTANAVPGTLSSNAKQQLSTSVPLALDKWNFANGRYYPVNKASFGSGWALENNWTPADGLPTRDGFVNRPMLVSSRTGPTMSLTFTGTAIGMALISGKDAGILEWSVDGSPFRQKDLFTQWSTMLHLPWYILLETGLKNKIHILTLRMADGKNPKSSGNVCRIVHFLINQP